MTKNLNLMNNLFRIGAVSRLTGIPADTLRIWERRYQVTSPQRTEKGGRLYSQKEVNRLAIIKTLVDQGHAISTIAKLNGEDLEKRLRQTPSDQPIAAENILRICIVGQVISIRARNAKDIPENIELLDTSDDLETFIDKQIDCDTLLLEVPFIDKETIRTLTNPALQQHCKNILVVYAFSPSNMLKQLERHNIKTERAPTPLNHLWQKLINQPAKPSDWQPSDFLPDSVSGERIPKRIFNSEQLSSLSDISTTLKCECPHHMSSIIETLVAFEQYSNQCENETSTDAALHSYLHVMTAKARWLLEVALEKLTEVEGIDIKGSSNNE